jgi:GntR family transcriptional regulator, carbon starvation induced regulator
MKTPQPKTGSSALPTMSSVVYANLRQEILRGELRPTEKLQIDQLCDRYGVTSTPVREALNQLAMEGFVQRQDQRGFYVAEATVAEFGQLTNTRCWVEPIALREAIVHRTEEWEERLVIAFHRLSRMGRSTDREKFEENPDWEKAHRVFHMALISTCPSHWLVKFCGLLFDHAARYRNLAMSAVYPHRDIAGEHKEILEAAINGQADEAVGKLVNHYRQTALIIEDLAAKPASAGARHRTADGRTPGKGKRNTD